MNIPCPSTIDCPGSDWPTLNLSAEAPDRLYFAGTMYPPFDPYEPPPLGDDKYYAHDCYGNVFSVQSQEVADLLAEITSTYCQNPDPPKNPTTPDEPAFCYNETVTVTKTCPNGTVLSYTVDAGMIVNPLPNAGDADACQAAANAKALAYAKAQLARLKCPDLECSISTNATLPDGTVSTPYSMHIVGTLPAAARWYVSSGTLPAGLTLNGTTGIISGTPMTAGTYHFTIGTRFP